MVGLWENASCTPFRGCVCGGGGATAPVAAAADTPGLNGSSAVVEEDACCASVGADTLKVARGWGGETSLR